MMAGSGSLLAVDTLGFSSARLERDVTVDVVPDDEAYLALDEDGVTGDLVFEEDVDAPTRCATVENRLHEAVDVEFAAADGGLRFAAADEDCPCGGNGELRLEAIEPGTAKPVAVSLADPTGPVTDTVEIGAATVDATVSIAAEREITLEDEYLLVIHLWKFPTTYLTVWKRPDGTCVLEIVKETDEGVKTVVCKQFPSLWRVKKHLLTVHLDGDASSVGGLAASGSSVGPASSHGGRSSDVEIVTATDEVADVSHDSSSRGSIGTASAGGSGTTIEIELEGEGRRTVSETVEASLSE